METEIKTFKFTFRFTVGGMVDSDISLEESKERLYKELSAFYGDAFEIIDFTEASPEEVTAYKEMLDEEPSLN